MKRLTCVLAIMLLLLCVVSGIRAEEHLSQHPEQTDADFAMQGEYSGKVTTDDGLQNVGVQVIALGSGRFRAIGYMGGLPGDGWDKSPKEEVEATAVDGIVSFKGVHATGTVRGDRVMTVVDDDGRTIGTLPRIIRKSPTLGQRAPQGAVVLFDRYAADKIQGGRVTKDGLLAPPATSKQLFDDHQLHLEFRLPFQPHDRGQARGNSGVYLQGRYEVQMLDSFGLTGEHNECGGIYSVKAPDVNMCYPPMQWQTYDVDYQAARYDAEGKLVASPRISVRHNGVVVHDDVELPGDRSTTAAPVKPGREPGPLYLQDHRNPVRYRNIWIKETS